MRIYSAILCVLWLAVAVQVSRPAAAAGALPGSGKKGSAEHLTFVREFSSAHDLKHPWDPTLNRAVDIIAGPAEGSAATDALEQPYAVTTDTKHRVFVTDLGAEAVHVFDFAHSRYGILHGGERLRSPMGVATDREGHVYVSDSNLRNVLVYDPGGKFSHDLKRSKGHESYFDAPRGIAVEPSTQHIYVCDALRHMVIMLDKEGRVLARLGKRGGGSGPGEFKYPTQVVAAEDEVVVFDSGNSRVQILDARGHFQKEIKLADVSIRTGLAMDADKNIYLTDPQLDRLRVFNPDGQFLYEFGQKGAALGQFDGISGIWVDSGHCLYVAETHNKRVQLFQINGTNRKGCS